MDRKKFMMHIVSIYFTLVTLITLATFVLGSCFEPEASFGYEAFATPLLYGACGLIPTIIMYTNRELTIKEIVVRKIAQLIFIEIMILFLAFYRTENTKAEMEDMITMGISVLIIYILVHIIDWIQNCMFAKKMTEQLMELQGKVNPNENY